MADTPQPQTLTAVCTCCEQPVAFPVTTRLVGDGYEPLSVHAPRDRTPVIDAAGFVHRCPGRAR